MKNIQKVQHIPVHAISRAMTTMTTMTTQNRLFIFHGVFFKCYTSGFAVAVASSEERAIEAIVNSADAEFVNSADASSSTANNHNFFSHLYKWPPYKRGCFDKTNVLNEMRTELQKAVANGRVEIRSLDVESGLYGANAKL